MRKGHIHSPKFEHYSKKSKNMQRKEMRCKPFYGMLAQGKTSSGFIVIK